jgi:stage II sporulation protein P
MRRKRRYRKGRYRKVVRRKKRGDITLIVLSLLIFLNISLLTINYFRGKNDKEIVNIFFDFLNFKGKEDDLADKSSKLDDTNLEKDIEDEDEFNKYEESLIIDKLDEYESLIIIKDSHGISSIENIPKPLNINKIKLDKQKDYILMYHTHSTESYLTEDPNVYYNSDPNKSVVSTGRTLATVLEANGHKVDHVETAHDSPSLSGSYSRSLNTINKKKEENPNLKILFDIHRDGVENNASYKDKFLQKAKIDINGVSTATFSLVVGPDAANYEKVLNFAKYIKAVSDTIYPNLCTGIIVKPTGRYNLYTSDYSALIEMGSNLVTLEEANESAKLVGEILSLVIDSIIE